VTSRLTAAFGFLLTVLLIPGLAGGGTTPRWALAAVAIPLLIPARRVEFTSAHLFGLLFLVYAAVSVAWSHPYDGLDALVKLAIIAGAFVLGSKLEDIRPLIIGCGLGIWVSSLVMLTGFEVPHATPNAGLFVNSNSMGEIAAVVLVAALFHRIWWLVPGILPAFLMAQCRGAFVAVAGAFVLWLLRKSKVAALALVGLALAALWVMASSRTAGIRLDMWKDVLPNLTLAGHGLGSFFSQYPFYASMDTTWLRPEHLHNDWLEYVFELGIGSVFLFAFVWLTRNILLAVIAIEACFGFPLHVAATAVLFGVIAGHDVRHRLGLRDDLAAWGISLRKWTGRAGPKGYHRHEGSGVGLPA